MSRFWIRQMLFHRSHFLRKCKTCPTGNFDFNMTPFCKYLISVMMHFFKALGRFTNFLLLLWLPWHLFFFLTALIVVYCNYLTCLTPLLDRLWAPKNDHALHLAVPGGVSPEYTPDEFLPNKLIINNLAFCLFSLAREDSQTKGEHYSSCASSRVKLVAWAFF